MHLKKFSLLLVCWALHVSAASSEPTIAATVLYLTEKEAKAKPYDTRMIITKGFVRMDGGKDKGDFILFDRTTGDIFSVSVEDQQILVMRSRKLTAKPSIELKDTVVRDTSPFPSIEGSVVSHVELKTNGKRCYDLFAATTLMPDVVTALRQYRQSLAAQQAQTLAVTPEEFKTPCDLANNVFAPARHLEFGFPIRLEDMTGKVIELINFNQKYRATESQMSLPLGYKSFMIEELQKK